METCLHVKCAKFAKIYTSVELWNSMADIILLAPSTKEVLMTVVASTMR